jgi:hypothetical protein
MLMPGPPLPSSSASVSDLLEAATRVFRATLLKCMPLTIIGTLFSQLPNAYWIMSGHSLRSRPTHDPTFTALDLVGLLFYLWFVSAAMLRQRALLEGAVPTLHELRTALALLPGLLLTVLLALLGLFVGLLLLLVPGLFLLVCFLVLTPVVLFERRTGYAALRRCVELIRPIWWKTCAVYVIATLVAFICLMLVFLLLGVVILVAGGGAVIQALATTVVLVALTMTVVFSSAVMIVLHSAASSSA